MIGAMMFLGFIGLGMAGEFKKEKWTKQTARDLWVSKNVGRR